jgi:Helix-turn-helix domain
MNSTARWKARSQVISAVSMSAGARLMYLFLDDMDFTGKGCAWPKQTTIAAKVGLSRRETQRCLEELRAGGWIEIERRRAHCVYWLKWRPRSERDAPPVTHLENRDAPPVTHHDAPPVAHLGPGVLNITEATVIEPSVCTQCEGTGYRIFGERGDARVYLCGCRHPELTLYEAERRARKDGRVFRRVAS